MAPDDRWLAAVWPFVRGQLPPAPATVLEVGCGTLGGFVPALGERGYQALGVDPEAPEGSDYQRVEFEQYEPQHLVDCVVASLSLHHVADLDAALDRLQDLLVPAGKLVVVEWAWERFDEATARWGLRPAGPARPRGRAGLAAQAPGAVGGLRTVLGRLPLGVGHRGGPAPRRADPARAGHAVHPRARCRRAVPLCRPGRYRRGRGAGRHRRWPDSARRHPIHGHARLTGRARAQGRWLGQVWWRPGEELQEGDPAATPVIPSRSAWPSTSRSRCRCFRVTVVKGMSAGSHQPLAVGSLPLVRARRRARRSSQAWMAASMLRRSACRSSKALGASSRASSSA